MSSKIAVNPAIGARAHSAHPCAQTMTAYVTVAARTLSQRGHGQPVVNALNVALQKYEGTVLLVTHDQDLLEEVGTRVWQFDGGRITDFKGSYEEFAGATA